jgi:Kef-type K+ transport system membrane component KefB
LAFIGIVVKWGTMTANRVIPRFPHEMRSGESQFAAAMVLMFALSALGVYVGVAAIIGAFLAGMVLSESVDQRVHDLTQGVTELLVPFFLVGIGLRFNVASFSAWPMVAFALLLFLVAVISKILGCGLGSYRLGRMDAARVGVGMIPRGEVGMVVAQIGLSLGVVSSHMYDAVIFMVITSTLAAPPLLKKTRVALEEQLPIA